MIDYTNNDTELEVSGLRERRGSRPVQTFVTISVDGKQPLETPHVPHMKWVFDEPLRM